MKSLINIKKNDNKCFLWCHFRYLNPLKIYPERIKKADKNMINDLEYESIEFLYLKKILARLNKKSNISTNVFCNENDLIYPVCISDKKFENCMDLLLITSENRPHYVYIKDFNRVMCNKTKNDDNKKHFRRDCLQCFTSERVLIEHKKVV